MQGEGQQAVVGDGMWHELQPAAGVAADAEVDGVEWLFNGVAVKNDPVEGHPVLEQAAEDEKQVKNGARQLHLVRLGTAGHVGIITQPSHVNKITFLLAATILVGQPANVLKGRFALFQKLDPLPGIFWDAVRFYPVVAGANGHQRESDLLRRASGLAQDAVGDLVRRAIAAHGYQVASAFGNGGLGKLGGVHFSFGENGVEGNARRSQLRLDVGPALAHSTAAAHGVHDEAPMNRTIFALFFQC